LTELDLRGGRSVPNDEAACRKLLDKLNSRVEAATIEFDTLASGRVADSKLRAEIVALMLRWLVLGKPSPAQRHDPDAEKATQPDADT
jgi:hypothetical protein